MSELLTRTFFGGVVRLHILYHAIREPVFGVEMMEELARHGYEVGPGTLYPILHQLEQAGYLVSHAKVMGGKQRKYYRATPEGARAMEEARARLRELVKEVLHDDPPTPLDPRPARVGRVRQEGRQTPGSLIPMEPPR